MLPCIRETSGCGFWAHESYPHFDTFLDAQVILFHQGVLAQLLRCQDFTASFLWHGAILVQFCCACVANSVTLTQGRHEHGNHRPTSRQERPASLSRPSAPQGRTPALCHIHQALRCSQVGAANRGRYYEGRHLKTAETKRRTLADLIDRYIVDILPNKGASSIRKQTQQLLWWKARLGYCIVADITPALIASTATSWHEEAHHTRQRNGQPLSRCLVSRLYHRRQRVALV